MAGVTPMMRQYRAIKQKYQGAILLFRLGDFYEMFFEDAEIAARELEITLTSREAGKGKRVPMAGVPYHAAETYIARLLARGYRVAICEQVEDPRLARGVVKREVIRVVTPGTVLDRAMLDETRNNYLVALLPEAGKVGLAVLDATTGEFLVTEFPAGATDALREELCRLQPSECLLPRSLARDDGLTSLLGTEPGCVVTPWDDSAFDPEAARRLLMAHFGTASLEGFGCEGLTQAVGAAGAALGYFQETQKAEAVHISSLRTYSAGEYMLLDATTRRNLELTRTIRTGGKEGTLLWVLEETVTPMGARMLRRWVERPLLQVEAIRERLEAVEELFVDQTARFDLRSALKGVHDLERLNARVACATANCRDLVALKQSLHALGAVARAASSLRSPLFARLAAALDTLEDVAASIEAAIVDDPPAVVTEGGLIKGGFDPEVDRLREAARGGKNWVAELEAQERARTGIKSLRVGFNRVFGYYLEVTRPNLHLVPPDYVRRQTLTSGERFVTPELKEKEELILGAEEKLATLEYEIFCRVRLGVAAHAERIQRTAGAVAQLDVLASLAEVAARRRYIRPEVDEGERIAIKEGRHPVLEAVATGEPFVPNDAYLDRGEHRVLVVTGPNMAGKSTYLRQIALITLMAQMGSFVPAARAQVGLVDRIFTRVGAYDDLVMGQSTFLVEMNEVANILNNATSRSLILLDEIGRGTSTFDGLSIAWAVIEYIHDPSCLGARALLATHYHELTELEEMLPAVKNFRVAVRESGDAITFLRKVVRGSADKSYGIQVARLAGLPRQVIERAREILAALEQGENTVKREQMAARVRRRGREAVQLALFEAQPHPALEELRGLEIESMTPLEALSKLDELRRKARGADR